VVDLDELNFLGSSGITVLVEHHQRCNERGDIPGDGASREPEQRPWTISAPSVVSNWSVRSRWAGQCPARVHPTARATEYQFQTEPGGKPYITVSRGDGLMNDRNDSPGAAAGIPQANPPKGGPHEDENTPSPEDLTPGFGGTSESKPASTEEETPDRDNDDH
jgi:hypothetical protein